MVDTLVKILSESGENVFLILLILCLLFAIVVLWRGRESSLEKMRTDGLAMASALKETSEKLDRLTDAIEAQSQSRRLSDAALTANSHELVRLRDTMESEGRLNRFQIDAIQAMTRAPRGAG